MGGEDGDYQSLMERLAKVEKKHDMLDVYINYAASAQAREATGSSWQTRFANKEFQGQNINYSKESALGGKHSNRIELGFMYRIKCY